ncbi:MAG: recombinase family protein [Candidatus Pacebacteria bacterium]|nr:recombinase family protein [Candidatus Paceibacterota bacterium]
MDNQPIGLIGATAQPNAPVVERVKYVLYARKSTESDEKQALSIDSQVKEMLQIAERENLEIVDIRREAHSAKDSGQRPVFSEILRDIRTGRYSGILTWAPDRLSRNAGDLGSLVDLMDQKILIEIRTYGQRFTNSPNEKFLLMILCSQAKLENDNKSVNVKRGLRTRCEMGLWPSVAPTGYFNEKRVDRKGYVILDTERAPVIRQMFEKVANEKWSGRKIYHWLRFELNFRNKSGKHLTLSTIFKILQTPFYCGSFEYPLKSGKWYTGKHQPIITRELFEKTREQLKRDRIAHGEPKEFAFTRLMTCGLCGSGITAQEKFKEIKSTGLTARYVYYGCTRGRDINCKCGYMREEEIIKQLIDQIDNLVMDEKLIRGKFEEEYKRLKKFQNMFLGIKKAVPQNEELNPKDYAIYVLSSGTLEEKRELMNSIKNKITMKENKIYIEE